MQNRNTAPAGAWDKIQTIVKTLIQRFVITVQVFKRNGLANHAAAGAYGFLLSIAPMLLMLSFFLLFALRSSPEMVAALIKDIPFLDIVFDEHWLTSEFFTLSQPGISGIIFLLSIFWAGRIFAVSLKRGLRIIFTGAKKRNPLRDNLTALAVEVTALVFALVVILYSQMALRFIRVLNIFPQISETFLFSSISGRRLFSFIAMALILFCAYIFIPENPPRKMSALHGSIFCVFSFGCISMALNFLLNRPRFDFLYGALGSLIIQLVNVYFFFLLFFAGAQLAFVIDFFDGLLFLKMRQARTSAGNKKFKKLHALQKALFSCDSGLKKYSRFYKKGDIIFSNNDGGDEIFYLLEGEISVFNPSLLNSDAGANASVMGPDSFFGVMSHLLSGNRTATIRAKTDVLVLALPPKIFDEILKYDTSVDRAIIGHLSQSLQKSNEQIAALVSKAEP
ncbi:MAG: YihY/virulence factor BrkB family protein [Treponema sp.]|nr:YihY/virulence factor BrkB family protein [Treponema sp.]